MQCIELCQNASSPRCTFDMLSAQYGYLNTCQALVPRKTSFVTSAYKLRSAYGGGKTNHTHICRDSRNFIAPHSAVDTFKHWCWAVALRLRRLCLSVSHGRQRGLLISDPAGRSGPKCCLVNQLLNFEITEFVLAVGALASCISRVAGAVVTVL